MFIAAVGRYIDRPVGRYRVVDDDLRTMSHEGCIIGRSVQCAYLDLHAKGQPAVGNRIEGHIVIAVNSAQLRCYQIEGCIDAEHPVKADNIVTIVI